MDLSVIRPSSTGHFWYYKDMLFVSIIGFSMILSTDILASGCQISVFFIVSLKVQGTRLRLHLKNKWLLINQNQPNDLWRKGLALAQLQTNSITPLGRYRVSIQSDLFWYSWLKSVRQQDSVERPCTCQIHTLMTSMFYKSFMITKYLR